ncbi:MAG: hypothetical protein ACRYHQ_01735 [Janthinobacterium lividum]
MKQRATFLPAPGETIAAADLVVVRPIDALGFIAAMARGDRHAARLMRAVDHALHRLDAAPRKSPLLCAACPDALRPDKACSFVVHLSADERLPFGFALAVCRRCATSRADIRRKAIVALRTELPDLRVVDATHASGGRA